MKQYCRYCGYLVTGNGIYCTLKQKELSESYAKHTNKCKDFVFNEVDAFFENEKPYHPRSKYKKTNTVTSGEQITLI